MNGSCMETATEESEQFGPWLKAKTTPKRMVGKKYSFKGNNKKSNVEKENVGSLGGDASSDMAQEIIPKEKSEENRYKIVVEEKGCK